MATKSKSIEERGGSLFCGVLSWLCMLLALCALAVGAAILAVTAAGGTARYGSDFTVGGFLAFIRSLPNAGDAQLPALTVLLFFLTAVLLTFLFRTDRRALESSIARRLGKIWVEIKLLVLFLLGLLFFAGFSAPLFPSISLIVCVPLLTLYFLCLDIGHNKRFFRHNIIRSILRRVNSYRQMTTFQQRSLRRVYSCLAVAAGVAVLTALILVFLAAQYQPPFFLYQGALAFGVIGVVGTAYWYILALKQDLRDWNTLMAQIAEMYEGNLDAVNHVPPTSNLYECAMQLNSIRIGIQKAVDEGVRADRTKVELITNVSHDIKTPLTSIISYIELLKKEPDLPAHVMDYINTISQKADRLRHIVQDVFEVSKAATGNISLNMEDLDMGKLLRQTFAEMEEILQNPGLTWRVDIPEAPVLIHADGQRMYRVFQNLLRNCAQYSLEGSRVYVQLTVQNGQAQTSIRNISKNEIVMNAEDLTARFVRGDQNRTTEGSGLGLSIAKSFTEACGGLFSIHTDGDLFWVTVSFPLVEKVPLPEAVPKL